MIKNPDLIRFDSQAGAWTDGKIGSKAQLSVDMPERRWANNNFEDGYQRLRFQLIG